jgi:predicted phosphodiesterase
LNKETEKGRVRRKYGSGINFAIEKLSMEWMEKLSRLHAFKSVTKDNLRFDLCHGSPWDRDCYIYPDCNSDIINRCSLSESDFVLMGHTHYPFVRCCNNTTIANSGSVGQPRDRNSVGSWLVIDTENRSLVFQNTPFDSSSIIEDAKKIDPHLPYLHEVLTSVRKT